MRARAVPVLTVLFAAAVAAAVPAAPPDAPTPVPAPAAAPDLPVRVARAVIYATVDGQTLVMDIAGPKGGGPYPGVVTFHGGAWRGGSRLDLSRPVQHDDGAESPSIIEQIAARGYVVATAGYRLAPKSKFPAQVEDARTAVRFLRANAKK